MEKQISTLIMVITTVVAFSQCPAGQTEVSIDVSTDNWGYEVYWELTPTGNTCGSGSTIFSGGNSAVGCNSNNAQSGGYPNGTTISEGPWCLNNNASYDILSRDGYGDGGADFLVMIATLPLYTFSAGAASETFSFAATPPPAIDGSLQHVETPSYVFIGAVDVKGEMKNLGSTTINSMDVNYSINAGATVTQSLSSLNIVPFTTFSFIHPTTWYPSTIGTYTLDLWISICMLWTCRRW